MYAFLPFSLYKAASIFANDIAEGYNVDSNRQMLEFILDTTKLFQRYFKGAHLAYDKVSSIWRENDSSYTAVMPELNSDIKNNLHRNFKGMGPVFDDPALADDELPAQRFNNAESSTYKQPFMFANYSSLPKNDLDSGVS